MIATAAFFIGTALATVTNVGVENLELVAGLVIPLLVGVGTRYLASSYFKLGVNVALSVVAGAVQQAIEADGLVDVRVWVTSTLVTLAVSMLTYHGILKPTGVARIVQGLTEAKGLKGPGYPDHLERMTVRVFKGNNLEDVVAQLAEAVQTGAIYGDDGATAQGALPDPGDQGEAGDQGDPELDELGERPAL